MFNLSNFSVIVNQSVVYDVEPDWRQAEKSCQEFWKFVINFGCAGLLCVFGTFGNCISYIAIGQDRDILPVARFLLRSLATADTAFLGLWFVQFSVNDLIVYLGLERQLRRWLGWLYFRLISYPMLFACQTLTIWLTVLVAASRYLVVCRPARAVRVCSLPATRLSVAAVVLFSIVYNLPRYFETEIIFQVRNNKSVYRFVRTSLGNNELYGLIYFDIMYYAFSFALPLTLLTVFNTRLMVAYRDFRRKREALRVRHVVHFSDDGGAGSSSHEQSVTLIMIVIIIVFMLCNAPGKIVQIAWTYREPFRCHTPEFFIREIVTVFELLSSSVNFVIYCACLKKFYHNIGRYVCFYGGRGGGWGCIGCCCSNRQRIVQVQLHLLHREDKSGDSRRGTAFLAIDDV